MKEYKPVVVKSHIFVTSAQNGDWSPSCRRITSTEQAPGWAKQPRSTLQKTKPPSPAGSRTHTSQPSSPWSTSITLFPFPSTQIKKKRKIKLSLFTPLRLIQKAEVHHDALKVSVRSTPGTEPRYSLNRTLGGAQIQSRRFAKEKNLFTYFIPHGEQSVSRTNNNQYISFKQMAGVHCESHETQIRCVA